MVSENSFEGEALKRMLLSAGALASSREEGKIFLATL
jgi:hypothetical protein